MTFKEFHRLAINPADPWQISHFIYSKHNNIKRHLKRDLEFKLGNYLVGSEQLFKPSFSASSRGRRPQCTAPRTCCRKHSSPDPAACYPADCCPAPFYCSHARRHNSCRSLSLRLSWSRATQSSLAWKCKESHNMVQKCQKFHSKRIS